jgi:glyoxylase-like metal-dependent hydrolase (beta-lactamase superfamily II)
VTVPAAAGATVLRAEVYSSPFVNFEAATGTFSPTTSTLVFGSAEAVLIDAQHIRSDVAVLADMIEQTGRKLTTIYVTHDHPDHWYGVANWWRDSFPGALLRAPESSTRPPFLKC